MATTERIIIPTKAQALINHYLDSVMQSHRRFQEFRTKLTAIDVAYYCYRAKQARELPPELDVNSLVQDDSIDVPLIVSQVDSLRAYFADVYLSGSPLFPVAGAAERSELVEGIEALIEKYAIDGKYARHLMLAFTDCAKYNFCAVEALPREVAPLLPAVGNAAADKELIFALRRLDPYNTIFDYRVDAADVAEHGEYAGDVRLVSRTQLKRILNALSERDAHMNVRDALESGKLVHNGKEGYQIVRGNDNVYPLNYSFRPQVSHFIASNIIQNGGTWEDFIERGTLDKRLGGAPANLSNLYELTTIYARIIPAEFGIKAPRAKTPQVWKFVRVNNSVIIEAARVLTPHELLPVVMAQPNEDGFGIQTHAIAEAALPLQQVASNLFNAKIASMKRAINDRMLYDPELVDPLDINSPTPAAKIPVKATRYGKSLNEAAKHLPYDASGTVGVLQDLQQTMQLSYMLSGLNPFRQGQTQKGNRTLEEFNSIISFSDLRTRVLALMLEMQLMIPVKQFLKFHVMTHIDEVHVFNPRLQRVQRLTRKEIASSYFEFKIADGFTPKSKLMSTDDLQAALMFIQANPQLAQEYDIGAIFAHLMSLRGVKNLNQYRRQQPLQMPQVPPAGGNANDNNNNGGA